ncbi:helix-turn-helix transcriptional regulator [Flavobacterium oreochromis]|uniref:helix-turn-helix domain-containing protein n=1 Tax=Flavobacterium oreochromis TaxID=2906078 RepID=UPI001CE52C05|nr:helix-turn-helix transcriptional regulator [Flavobacterium oreochromis]QYS87234.1 helix-turn-helix transcriptional regulator [Flavobacterium oreochromis]
MNIGNRIADLRKKKNFSREDLGKLVGTSGAVIGRYEREEITPSVEIANKIALSLGVSLDYLVGNVELELNDILMEKVKEVNKMSEKDKDYVYTLIDAFIARSKLQTILK